MTLAKVIRYKTHPEKADENEFLIRAVFVELAKENPQGLNQRWLTQPVRLRPGREPGLADATR
jgi:hypothetical protein